MDIRSVGQNAHRLSAGVEGVRPDRRQHHGTAGNQNAATDRVELSAAALNHDPGAEAPGAPEQRIRALRAQIAADSYITPDKIDVVVERLYQEIFGSDAP